MMKKIIHKSLAKQKNRWKLNLILAFKLGHKTFKQRLDSSVKQACCLYNTVCVEWKHGYVINQTT